MSLTNGLGCVTFRRTPLDKLHDKLTRTSWVQRLEIEDPVEDEKGYTYEKSAIINYIKEEGRNGSVKCPAGGEWFSSENKMQMSLSMCRYLVCPFTISAVASKML